MRKLSNSDCDEMKDCDSARKMAKNEDYYGRNLMTQTRILFICHDDRSRFMFRNPSEKWRKEDENEKNIGCPQTIQRVRKQI